MSQNDKYRDKIKNNNTYKLILTHIFLFPFKKDA